MSDLPIVILTEGEFDAILAWQHAADFAGVATLGSAAQRLDDDAALDLVHARRIYVAYDTDQAGAAARAYWAAVSPRVVPVTLPNLPGCATPAHDITAFWQSGGDLRTWLASVCQPFPSQEQPP